MEYFSTDYSLIYIEYMQYAYIIYFDDEFRPELVFRQSQNVLLFNFNKHSSSNNSKTFKELSQVHCFIRILSEYGVQGNN